MHTYNAIIEHHAATLRARMREAVAEGRQGDLTVFAIRTSHERDGYLHIDYDYPPGLHFSEYEVVRPLGYSSWAAVPYANIEPQLWHACRSQPILPLERTATVRQRTPRYARAA